MKCSKCMKDLTGKYKFEFRDVIVCLCCYRKIPYHEKVADIKEKEMNRIRE